MLFIFVDDIDNNISSRCLKFADDTNVYNRVVNDEDARVIQRDIDKFGVWGEQWDMLFNVDKCKVLHLGHQNPGFR